MYEKINNITKQSTKEKKSQIFIKPISQNIVYDLLNNVTQTESEYRSTDIDKQLVYFYRIDTIVFKKMQYHNILQNFIDTVKEYYYPHKRESYINRPITYNNFLTIIRHICRYNSVDYKRLTIYDKSKYSIEYIIYLNE